MRAPVPSLLRLLAVLYILLGLVLLAIMAYEAYNGLYFGSPLLSLSVVAVVGLLMVTMGMGFLRGLNVYFWLSVGLIVILIIIEAARIIEGDFINTVYLAVALLVLYFLTRPKIKVWFGLRPNLASRR